MEGKIKTEFFALRPKPYSYLDHNCNEHKKTKGTKKDGIEQKTIFENFKRFVCSWIKIFIDHKKDLKAIIIMFTQKKLIM